MVNMQKNNIIVTSYNFGNNKQLEEIIEKYIQLGISKVRVNCTRYDYEEYIQQVNMMRKIYRAKTNEDVEIYLDLPYPGQKVRIKYDGDNDEVEFKRNDIFTLVDDESKRNIKEGILSVDSGFLISDSNIGDKLLYADGNNNFIVVEKGAGFLKVKAENAGIFSYGKSLYSKKKYFNKNTHITEIIKFVKTVMPTGVMLSFVETMEGLAEVCNTFSKLGILVIPKIETPNAVENIDEICGSNIKNIVLGRGDLGVISGWDRFTLLQEKVLEYCNTKNINVIAATGILNSIKLNNIIPERADLTDLYYLMRNGVREFVASAYLSKNEDSISKFVEIINSINIK